MNSMYEFYKLTEGDQTLSMQACQAQALQIVSIERKQGSPDVEEIVQDALNQSTTVGMTEDTKAALKEKKRVQAAITIQSAQRGKVGRKLAAQRRGVAAVGGPGAHPDGPGRHWKAQDRRSTARKGRQRHPLGKRRPRKHTAVRAGLRDEPDLLLRQQVQVQPKPSL